MIRRAGKADIMRAGRYLVLLAGVAVLAAGCGTERAAQTVNVAAAAASTASQRARVTVTTAMRTQGMSISFTETGVFDFAGSRGLLRMTGPAGRPASEELFVPPEIYLKIPAGVHGLLPRGKSWVAIGAAATGGLGSALLGPSGGADPGDLLSSLTAAASQVRTLGTATLRGVPVTHLRLDVDPAKAVAQVPPGQRAGVRAFATSLGAATMPVDVWVDQQDMVRQVRWSPRLPGGSPAPGGTRFTQTTDFYDFGVPVRVSAPPAGQVTTLSHLAKGASSSVTIGKTGSPRPPRASGTVSPAQAAAAAAAVRTFWVALGRNDARAAAQTVLPAQRACFRSMLGGPHFTVTSLAIVSVQPDGNMRAAVRFTVKARASLGGHSFPVLPEGPGRVQWLVATEASGHWYVDLARSSSLVFGPACGVTAGQGP
jgi:hypothetical protein